MFGCDESLFSKTFCEPILLCVDVFSNGSLNSKITIFSDLGAGLQICVRTMNAYNVWISNNVDMLQVEAKFDVQDRYRHEYVLLQLVYHLHISANIVIYTEFCSKQ